MTKKENELIDFEIPVAVTIETDELNTIMEDAIYEYLDARVLPEGIYMGNISSELQKFLYKKVKEILIKMWADD